jgi:hypothetical protein
MGLAIALIVMGMLILLDRMGAGYGLREDGHGSSLPLEWEAFFVTEKVWPLG